MTYLEIRAVAVKAAAEIIAGRVTRYEGHVGTTDIQLIRLAELIEKWITRTTE